MSDVKVTREHRLAAMDAVDPSRPRWLGKRWIETGEAHYSLQAKRFAETLAVAEHNLRAAVIADLRGLVERSFVVDNGDDDGPEYIETDSVRNLIDALEAQL